MANEITELIAELAYARIKASPFWHTLPSNDAIDAKADDLASAIQHFVDYWMESEPVQVVTFEAPALRSLSEANSISEETRALAEDTFARIERSTK